MVQYITTKVKKYRGIHVYINKLQDCIIAQKYPTQDVDSSFKFYTLQK